jgi:BirA family biotin operon repressor/biotin-[acetyl-CoA-carboxylase] ligase
LPDDLKLASASIYFGSLMSEILKDINSGVWLKWPNDIYINENKIAGVITKKIDNCLVCGIGINLLGESGGHVSLETEIEPLELLEAYLKNVLKFPKWKQVFSKVQLEFHKSKSYYLDIEKYQDIIVDAVLSNDGSLIINGEKVYSIR